MDALRFGPYELRPDLRTLRRDGAPVTLGVRAFDVLVALAERRDRVVTKEELLDLVWPGLVVEENNLQAQVSALRKAIGPAAIATLPGRGYRFIAEVGDRAPLPSPGAAAALPTAIRHRADADIIGRDNDIDGLCSALAAHRLVSIVGAGGVGKTTVARAVARRSAGEEDALAWVDLAPLPAGASAATVATALAAALGTPLGEGDAPALLARALADRSLLVVLDNAEHVAPQTAAVVAALCAGSPGLRLLVTSQVALHVPGEQVWRLESLALPPTGALIDEARRHGAFALFERRAREADHRFALGADDVQRVSALCHALDGNALAIELAAARAPQLGIGPLHARLTDALRLLKHPGMVPDRQRSLRGALAWSWSLLGSGEQAVLRRLAVFAGPFTLELAQQVATDTTGLDEWAVLDSLVVLVDRSLVQRVSDEPPRYRLLETTRLHAMEELTAANEADAAGRRHGQAMAALGVQLRTASRALSTRCLADTYTVALADLESAFERACRHGDAPTAGAVGLGLMVLQGACGLSHGMRARMQAGHELLPQAVEPLDRARLATLAAPWSSIALPTVPRLAAAQLRLAAWQAAADPAEVYLSLCQVTGEHVRAGDAAAAATTYAAAVAAEVPGWPAQLRIHATTAACDLALYGDEPGKGRRAAERMLELAKEANDEWLTLFACFRAADYATADGDMSAAITLGCECVAALQRIHRPRELGVGLANLCSAYLQAGDVRAARRAAARALPLVRRHLYAGVLFNHLSLIAARDGNLHAAARLLGHADAWYAQNQLSRRQATEARVMEPALDLIVAGVGAGAAAQLRTEGAALDDAAADALATRFLGGADPEGA